MTIEHLSRRIRRFLRASEAVSALEYALLIGAVTVAIGAAIATFSDTVSTVIENIGTRVTNTTNTVGTPQTPAPGGG